jgi:hypothetical protein
MKKGKEQVIKHSKGDMANIRKATFSPKPKTRRKV